MFDFVKSFTKQSVYSATAGLLVAAPLFAQSADHSLLDLSFVPPDIELTPVCVQGTPDNDLIERWSNWDGMVFPNLTVNQIKADVNRLKRIDVVRWKPTIEKIIARLALEDPSYSGASAHLAQILLLVDAGEFEELQQSELVPLLSANSDFLSPRIKNALSGFYRNGIGVSQNVEYADELLLEAGYSGNPDALLTLSKLEISGNGVDGWDLDPKLAVTIAFGTLVGELDSGICDRAARIAREFNNSEIVKRNKQLSHDWYRFSADLGDPTSAWRVVEYHMLAEGFERDNELMFKYLNQAVDAGFPYARIALARLYETGALIDQDLDKALEILLAASKDGRRSTLTRLIFFLRNHAEKYPHLKDTYLTSLMKMSEYEDAPGWVFSYLGEDVLERKGRWAGHDEAIAFLERAAELGDNEGILTLADNLVAQGSGGHDFERAVDLLSYSVYAHGGGTPTKRLYDMFMCQAPDSPRVYEANFWKAQEQAIESQHVAFLEQDMESLDATDQPLTVALIQSHALYGRSQALASYFQYLENSSELSPEKLDFWREYADQYLGVIEALSILEVDIAEVSSRRGVAFGLLREQYQSSGADSALSLARSLFLSETDEELSEDEIRSMLARPARLGRGAAMNLLVSLDPSDGKSIEIYRQFADAIDAKGDFQAQIFALNHVKPDQRAKYLSRAEATIPCDYNSTKALAYLYHSFGDTENAIRWSTIASHLVEGKSWAVRDLANMELTFNGPEGATRAKALFEQAMELGNRNAPSELFELLIDPKLATFNVEKASLLFEQASLAPDKFNLGKFLSLYGKAGAETKLAIESKIELPEVFLVSAESGNIYSMRAYGLHLREIAQTKDDLLNSTQWLGQSAKGGDTTAMTEYGYALAFGIGVDVDLDEALVWLDRASSKGSQKAMSIVNLVNLSKGI